MNTRLVVCALVISTAFLAAAAPASGGLLAGAWSQDNKDGFGNPANIEIMTIAPFKDALLAGTVNYDGAQLWRKADGSWSLVSVDGLGDSANFCIEHLYAFGPHLYAGTCNANEGAEIWRSNDGISWSEVMAGGFGDPVNLEVGRFVKFDGQLYAATWSADTSQHGSEIWRSASGDPDTWERVATNGFGDPANEGVVSLDLHGGLIYAATFNPTNGGQVWRSPDGLTWTLVAPPGFGSQAGVVSALAVYKGYLYASTAFLAGGEGIAVWRCQACDGTDWAQVVQNGFGNPYLSHMTALEPFEGSLYLAIGSRDPDNPGMTIWTTADGLGWRQVNVNGFGDPSNKASYFDNGLAAYKGGLYIGTLNFETGGEIWKLE